MYRTVGFGLFLGRSESRYWCWRIYDDLCFDRCLSRFISRSYARLCAWLFKTVASRQQLGSLGWVQLLIHSSSGKYLKREVKVLLTKASLRSGGFLTTQYNCQRHMTPLECFYSHCHFSEVKPQHSTYLFSPIHCYSAWRRYHIGVFHESSSLN